MTALLVKYCTNSFTVIWRGVLVNCLVPCYFFLFLSRSSVHGHAFTNSIAIFAHIVYTLLYWPFWNHLTCESSHLSSRGTLSCFAFLFQCSQSVLRNLSFFMSRDFVSPCSVLTQKNKLPLICQCSLICCHTVFLRTSRQLGLLGWVGGEEVCRGGVGGLVSQDFNTNEPPPPPSSHYSRKLSQQQYIFHKQRLCIFSTVLFLTPTLQYRNQLGPSGQL